MALAVYAFEGPDDSGKSTCARMLADAFAARGIACKLLVEPAHGSLARNTLVRGEIPGNETMLALMLTSMFEQDRIVREFDGVVIYDRREISAMAYQCIAPDRRDLLDFVVAASRDLTPVNVWIWMDCPLAIAAQRRAVASGKDQQAFSDIQERVTSAYTELLATREDTLHVDASVSRDEMFKQVEHLLDLPAD